MLIGQILSTNENVSYVMSEFADKFPETVEELQGKELDGFKATIAKLAKAHDAYGFIEYLTGPELKPFIATLKQKATKKKSFSFERLSFVMLPLFKFIEDKKMGAAGEMVKIYKALDQWFGFVHSHPSINLSTQFET